MTEGWEEHRHLKKDPDEETPEFSTPQPRICVSNSLQTHGWLLVQGWKEGPVTFLPTFKYKVGTHTYLGEAAAKEGLPPGSSSSGPAGAAAAALTKMSIALTEEDGEEDEEADSTAGESRVTSGGPFGF